MSRIRFLDSLTLDSKFKRTADGYLAATACVARTGIQQYRGYELGRPDLSVVNVYRPPSEVFNADAMKSMSHRPVTLTHPVEPVDAGNWSKYAKGHTGDEVVRDGDHIRVSMLVMDADTIKAILEDGTRELSMGYSTDLKWEKGVTPKGETYDAVQTDIRGNHLAIVPVARGGSTLRLGDYSPDQKRNENGEWTVGAVSALASGSANVGNRRATGLGPTVAEVMPLMEKARGDWKRPSSSSTWNTNRSGLSGEAAIRAAQRAAQEYNAAHPATKEGDEWEEFPDTETPKEKGLGPTVGEVMPLMAQARKEYEDRMARRRRGM